MVDFVFERVDRRALTLDFLQIVFQPFDLLFVSALIRVETFPKIDERLELIAQFFGRTRFLVIQFF